MSGKYSKHFGVPPGLPLVLKDFTREVLRAQPEEDQLFAFGYEYFRDLLEQEEQAQAGGFSRLSPDELQDLLARMFISADKDQSGALSMEEFKVRCALPAPACKPPGPCIPTRTDSAWLLLGRQDVLKMTNLGLSDREVMRVMAEADFDGNGEISYSEFIPLAVELIQAFYARMEAEEQKQEEEQEARDEARQYLLHGMTREQVEDVMRDVFRQADADSSGALSLAEFQKCCKDADIGLTKQEVNVLMLKCDLDGDGNISYDEFIPVCFEILVEVTRID